MDFRKRLFGKSGIVLLLLLIASGAGLIVTVVSRQANDSLGQSSSGSASLNTPSPDANLDIALPEDELNGLFQSHHDATTLASILDQHDLLSLMSEWEGKALFVKLDTTRSPHDLRYYYFDSLYQDSNRNAMQDPADQGFFNPASTVKVAIAALALETLNASDLTREADYRVAGTNRWYNFEEDIRLALSISDNNATNRLILWLGFDTINNKLSEKGLPDLIINRLMLDEGTLIESPAFEMRLNNEVVQQSAQPVTTRETCSETPRIIGNCATATDLVKNLMQINHPEYFAADQGFSLSVADREWLKTTLSRTPAEEGFDDSDYPDDYCRFLTESEDQFASERGKMLSKCGVSLFTYTYTDLSYLETDTGEKYYILLSLSPPRRTPESEIFRQMNEVANVVLSSSL